MYMHVWILSGGQNNSSMLSVSPSPPPPPHPLYTPSVAQGLPCIPGHFIRPSDVKARDRVRPSFDELLDIDRHLTQRLKVRMKRERARARERERGGKGL